MSQALHTQDLQERLSGVATREDLAALLREMHARADSPSLRALDARTAHADVRLTKSTVADMLAGRRFPRKAVLLAFLRECGMDAGQAAPWVQAWERIAATQRSRPAGDATELQQLREQLTELQAELAEADQARACELTELREQHQETTGRFEQRITQAEQRADQAEARLAELREHLEQRIVEVQRELLDTVVRRTAATCCQVAVTSVRGGAGKTTVAALTSSMMAKYRGERVLTIDVGSGLGSLPLRVGGRAELSLHDLASAQLPTWEEAATRYLAQTFEGFWVLSDTTGGRLAVELEIEQFQAAFGKVARYFSTAVIDCGAGLVNRLQRGILAGAHGQILVTPATVEGARSALGAIEWLNANGFAGLLPRTVITLVTHTPHADSDLDKAVGMLSSDGLPVIHIPYDRHLAAGTAIDMSSISKATRAAATQIAAEVFSRSVGL